MSDARSSGPIMRGAGPTNYEQALELENKRLLRGIRAFGYGAGADGKPVRSVNVRCLEGVDLDALPITHFDGKNR